MSNQPNDNRGQRRQPVAPTTARKVCFVVTRRGDKDYWTRIGAAFVNSDGSISVKLEALPINGEIQIRDYVPEEERRNG